MKRIITKAIIYSILSAICFAAENIEPDIEMGISAATSSIHSQLTLEDETLEAQIPQLPMTIHDAEAAYENGNENPNQHTEGQKLLEFLRPACEQISQYGIQTVSGLTVLGIWYKYFS